MSNTNLYRRLFTARKIALTAGAILSLSAAACSNQEPNRDEDVATANEALLVGISADDLYFRFWETNGNNGCKVSEQIVSILNTPHYRFAYAKYGSLNDGQPGSMPQNTHYEEYAQWEDRCYPGHNIYSAHSALAFSANIENWYSIGWGGPNGFDTLRYPIQVAPLPERLQNAQGTRYFILDGAHRAAYSAAVNRYAMIYANVVAAPNWPANRITDSIESVVDFPNLLEGYQPPAPACHIVLQSSGSFSKGVTDTSDDCDCPTVYRDADGDGYGDITAPSQTCNEGPGWVPNAADCCDSDRNAHPGAGWVLGYTRCGLAKDERDRGELDRDNNCDGQLEWGGYGYTR